jgi:GntR family transcriptional regulator of arabinose operon
MDWAIADPDISYVAPDDVEGGFRAANYLIKAGHRRIACIYPPNHFAGVQRSEGYRKALDAHGIPYDTRLSKPDAALLASIESRPVARPLVNELLKLNQERPTAIFCFNDILASQVVTAVREAGLSVPDDISVVGYDDSDEATQAEVPLTTVAHPKEFIGQWAAEILFDEIAHSGRIPRRHILVTPNLVLRDSVKRL